MIRLVLHKSPADRPEEGKEFLFPECFHELNGEQLSRIAHALYTESDTLKADVRVLHAILGRDIGNIDPEIVYENLLPFVQWVRKDQELTRQILPSISLFIPTWSSSWPSRKTLKEHKYYGPTECLNNLRFVEFDFAERELYSWHQDKGDIMKLYRFVACLYRPAKHLYDFERNPDGDPRETFNDNLIPWHANIFKKYLPEHYAYGIILWYKGCREHMMQQYPRVFSRKADEEGKQEEATDQPSYFSLMRMLAKQHIHGDFEKVEQLYVYTALLDMETELADQERMREHLENIGRDDSE